MARSVSARDQSGDDPNPNFPSAPSTQFSQSQYPFPIDSELTMTTNYSIPQFARQLDETAGPIDTSGNGVLSNMSIAPNGAASNATADAVMAPPQTPSQPFMPTAPHASGDESADTTQTPQTGERRKRSKTSRACDECRRKKIRCDAPAEADGTPKTCSNCTKAGVTCEFERKPMKRGPSKGYIKELAERVQQVEHVQKQALRQSLDGSSNTGIAAYAEPYSSDEPTSSTKRTFSFPDPGNVSPFTSSEFQRDRIPSAGVWGSSSVHPGLRPREAGSLSIAPNEPVPNQESGNTQNPGGAFWSESTLNEKYPPAKRQRIGDSDENRETVKMDPAFLSQYYEHVHRLFALLPKAEIVMGVVENSTKSVQYAFSTAIEIFPYPAVGVAVNGSHDANSSNQNLDTSSKPPKLDLTLKLFDNYDQLAQFLNDKSHAHSSSRSTDENLALIWTFLLVALVSQSDVTQMLGSVMPTAELVAASQSIIEYLQLDNSAKWSNGFVKDRTELNKIIEQAYNCTCLLGKYHGLSLGMEHWTLPRFTSYSAKVLDSPRVPVESVYLARSSEAFRMFSTLFYHDEPSRFAHSVMFGYIQPFLDQLRIEFPAIHPEQHRIHLEIKYFMALVTSRHVLNGPHPLFVLEAADRLAVCLNWNAAATSPILRYFNPIDMYAWSILVITLCEFVDQVPQKEMNEFANRILDEIRQDLQRMSDTFHNNYGFNWFWAPDQIPAETYTMKHWTDCLLVIIDYVKGQESSAVFDKDSYSRFIGRFGDLLKHGWIKVVHRFSSRLEESTSN
ncbi:uncharacterized protein Z518_03766 [Rhinocladiella mackenziei CBS 650.93]|uniref:Zn(2)-C6 fungal-type domain-containing protein n=1 Tax=Rhinocladiella mackenziei CBS 650.93 TaxID=1442369 RepID=A0A0D2IJ80_9EURO|nr:uncharacterized protein Z518_03766 [Rhinocladiella mackenziei CBS 650.93]KIX05794.1 hypothetical protein Z518_03766 [Rhinocladiella mackenziei CBS 650.93]